MKILFLHGWPSVPGGVKLTFLAQHGHIVINPKLPDDDFTEAIKIAQAELDRHQPQVVVASSRGGAVAMNINSGEAKLVLLCPAWKKWGTAKTVKPGTVILHSRADDVVPFADSEEQRGGADRGWHGPPADRPKAAGCDAASVRGMRESLHKTNQTTLWRTTVKAFFQAAAILGIFALTTPNAPACTGITIRPKDGSIIFARTLEFGMDLKSNILIVPRGKELVGTAPGDKVGMRWKTKYGIVGTNAFDLPVIVDGLNEKGLHVGLFYFPGFAKYQETKAEDFAKALAPWELGSFLLGTCSDAKEAVSAAKSVRVGAVVQKDMGFVLPVHYIVTDASGKSIVLEYIDGELKIHANPFGVMSNSPTFDWHMTNLSNYVTVTPKNIEKIDLAGKEITGLGQGSGMLGLPGDFTPPSRFVRAVAFSKTALPVEKAKDGVLQAFHILNQFDIPKGAARGIEQGKEVSDYTLWTSAADLKNLRYYFRTFDNSRIRMVDMRAVDLDAKEIKTISMKGEEQIEDVSGKAK